MAKREKVYLKDLPLYDEVDHEASAEQFPETYAKLDTLTHGSHKKLVWECAIGHSWPASVGNRSNGKGCPVCKRHKLSVYKSTPKPGGSFAEVHTHLVNEWDYSKNDVGPSDVSYSSRRKVWWKCSKGHNWESAIYHRSSGSGCPFCSGNKVSDANRLSIRCPDISLEWDYDRNELTPNEVAASSHKKFWWKCSQGHSWEASASNRSKNHGCPFCSGRLVTDSNRLSICRPELVDEWDNSKNALSPSEVSYSTNKKFWWKCSEGHSWEASVGSRSSGRRCPTCARVRRSEYKSTPKPGRSLMDRAPELIPEWDYDKNEVSPSDVSYSSHKYVWWVCSYGHKWGSIVKNRTKGQGCPKCATVFGKIEDRFSEAMTELTGFRFVGRTMRISQLKYESGRSGVEVDLVFQYEGNYLLLEYDGNYWHKGRESYDNYKSQELLTLGDHVFHARIRENDLPYLDLVHDRFSQFRHDYHASESDSIERTVKEIERWFRDKIGG